MTNQILSAGTITDDQINALRAEAVEHGDALQIALCDLALHDDSADPSVAPEVDESLRSKLEQLNVVPEHVDCTERARQRCADVVNDTWAQASL